MEVNDRVKEVILTELERIDGLPDDKRYDAYEKLTKLYAENNREWKDMMDIRLAADKRDMEVERLNLDKQKLALDKQRLQLDNLKAKQDKVIDLAKIGSSLAETGGKLTAYIVVGKAIMMFEQEGHITSKLVSMVFSKIKL